MIFLIFLIVFSWLGCMDWKCCLDRGDSRNFETFFRIKYQKEYWPRIGFYYLKIIDQDDWFFVSLSHQKWNCWQSLFKFCFHFMRENNLISSDNRIPVTLFSPWENLFIFALYLQHENCPTSMRWNCAGNIFACKIRFNSL